ncbi:MAG: hypothetical protein KF845_05655 [Cyclobacteriaceae bacterium]|nr:hypothetical protein [Cyclobacteriaceae bacterium]
MKKISRLFVFALFLFAAYSTTAQVRYDKGNVLVNAGLGFGYFYAGGVPITASAEFFINDAISIGPYLGFTSYNYRWTGYRYKYTFIDIGARGAYHFGKHIPLNTDKLDLYGGVILGYTVSSYSGDGQGFSNPYGSTVRAGIVAGTRWYFTDKVAINGEVGYGLAPLLVGLTFKL